MFILGLDLAQKQDFSALCAIEQTSVGGDQHYLIHGIERLPHGMPYPEQVRHVSNRVNVPTLRGSAMAVDQTGVGQAVVDMLENSGLLASIWPILITGGHAVRVDEDRSCYHVPKKELVGCLSVLLETRRLKMTAGLAFEDVLKKEMQSFSAKITTAGNEVFGAWREGKHDDLVLAVALACWLGENTAAGWDGIPKVGPKGPVAELPEEVFKTEREPAQDWRYHGGRAPQQGLEFPRW